MELHQMNIIFTHGGGECLAVLARGADHGWVLRHKMITVHKIKARRILESLKERAVTDKIHVVPSHVRHFAFLGRMQADHLGIEPPEPLRAALLFSKTGT